MAESDPNRDGLIDAVKQLEWWFEDRPDVYVSGNLMIYYVEGERASFSPDVFVVFGVEKRKRRTYKLWEEGKVPDFVLEISSATTWQEDMGNKRALYQRLGVSEYFLYDPAEEYLRPPLRGYRLAAGEYLPMAGPVLISQVLGLELLVHEAQLRFRDPATSRFLLTPDEQRQRAEAAEERVRELERRLREQNSP